MITLNVLLRRLSVIIQCHFISNTETGQETNSGFQGIIDLVSIVTSFTLS